MGIFIPSASAKNEPQMNADERRFIVPGLHRRGAGSLPGGAAPVEARGEEAGDW